MTADIRNVWPVRATLGEGPVWDIRRGVVWFVDIKERQVHCFDPQGGTRRSWQAPAQVGWVVPCDDGTLLAGLQTGLARFDADAGTFAHVVEVEPEAHGNRLNDATVGPDGCVWFGSMDDGETEPLGRVYRFDGALVRRSEIAAVPITNGPAISPDGQTLYHVDTLGRTIYAVPIADDGRTGNPRVFARIEPADGNPDGVTADALGNVWVGLWGGWRARCYAPHGGILREVRLPAANVTKIALGGPDLRTAYVTTARVGLSDAELASQPEAGGLFAFEVDVPGQAQPPARSARAAASA